MELVSIADVLRRRRMLLVIGLLLAVVGARVGGVLPPHALAARSTGEALASVVVDTRVPLVATTAPGADTTIVQRSVLLADLMDSDAMTALIAKRAGLAPDELTILGPVLAPVTEFSLVPDGQLPQLASAAAQTDVHTPYVVRIQPNYTVPIMSIGTAAPDVRGAVVLAQATIATLKSATQPTIPTAAAPTRGAIPSSAPKRAAGALSLARTPAASRPALKVESLGRVTTAAVRPAGVHLLRGVGAAIGLLSVWCVGMVIATGLARQWRRAGYPVAHVAG